MRKQKTKERGGGRVNGLGFCISDVLRWTEEHATQHTETRKTRKRAALQVTKHANFAKSAPLCISPLASDTAKTHVQPTVSLTEQASRTRYSRSLAISKAPPGVKIALSIGDPHACVRWSPDCRSCSCQRSPLTASASSSARTLARPAHP